MTGTSIPSKTLQFISAEKLGGGEEQIVRRTSFLYHYTSPSGAEGILQQDGLAFWFTRIDCFQDTMEGKDVIQNYRVVCEQLREDRTIDQAFFDHVADLKPLGQNFFLDPSVERRAFGGDGEAYVCCFCMEEDSPYMWSEYAKDREGKGYMFKISYTAFQGRQKKGNSRVRFRPVLYSDAEKQDKIRRLLLAYFDDWRKGNELVNADVVRYMLSWWQYFFKSESFREENEVRAVLILPKDHTQWDRDCTYYEFPKPHIVYSLVKGYLRGIKASPHNTPGETQRLLAEANKRGYHLPRRERTDLEAAAFVK